MKFYMLDLNILHCIHYEIATIAVMKCALLIELLCMQNVHREQQTDIVLNVLIILRMSVNQTFQSPYVVTKIC